MKCLILTLSFTVLSLTFCCAQTFENQKMLTTTFSQFNFRSTASSGTNGTVPIDENSSTFFAISPQITYGKVNKKNELYAYGMLLGYSYSSNFHGSGSSSNSTTYGAAPMILIQKFIRITDYFYLTPLVSLNAGYYYAFSSSSQGQNTSSIHSIGSSLTFIPISLTYVLNSKTNLIFSLGNLSSSFSYRTFKSNSGTVDFIRNTTNFSFDGSISSIRLGFQILLQE